jgi:peptide chain release factor 2
MRDFTEDLAEVQRRVDDARHYLRIDDGRERAAELEKEISKPDLWDDPDRARQVSTELARLNDDHSLVEGLERRVSDAQALHELAREENDDSF